MLINGGGVLGTATMLRLGFFPFGLGFCLPAAWLDDICSCVICGWGMLVGLLEVVESIRDGAAAWPSQSIFLVHIMFYCSCPGSAHVCCSIEWKLKGPVGHDGSTMSEDACQLLPMGSAGSNCCACVRCGYSSSQQLLLHHACSILMPNGAELDIR